ncbi:MAG: 2-oxoacid:acceptor oxidoreductase subunit alpha, partial [Candidatus Thermoplasmatota archaeon]
KPDLIKGVAGVAVLAACNGMDQKDLKELIEKEYSRGVEENLSFGVEVYEEVDKKIDKTFELEEGESDSTVMTGNESLSLGAAAGGLDIYIGYPMTPASSILHFFAGHKDDLQVLPIHPENEIGVANMAVGATVPGARVMVGTSGGGLALMEETVSLAGMTEAPVLFVLASRPGPSTGVPTYTEQADLNFALNQGHGEFPLIVASPGSVKEAFFLSNEMLELVWKYQTPGIFLTEKHLSESAKTLDIDLDSLDDDRLETKMAAEDEEYKRYEKTEDGISPLKFPPAEDLIQWNSYEHDEMGYTTENAETVEEMHDKRREKNETLILELKEMNTVNEFNEGDTVIFTFGSTTMSVREALKFADVDAKIVQPVYLNPFPVWELEEYMGEDAVVVEQNSTGQLATLLREKCRIKPKTVIRKYDGRAFEPRELASKLEEAIK